MQTKFVTRFGKEVRFEKKETKFYQLPGESFLEALVRTYYPKDYRRIQRMRLAVAK